MNVTFGRPDKGVRGSVKRNGGRRFWLEAYGKWRRIESLAGGLVPMEYLAGITLEKTALLCEADFSSRGTVEEAYAKIFFKFGNVLAYCRLGKPQRRGGGSEIT